MEITVHEEIKEFKNPTFFSKRDFIDVRFSSIKRRSGKESVPLFGLDAGIHHIAITNNRGKRREYIVKIWPSPYGWAWQALNEIETIK